MISITPNLRNVKPSSKYMEKRIRMFGRSRLANEYSKTGSNQRTLVLPWVPTSKDLLEIYHDNIRMLDGWSLNGSVVTFTKAMNGTLSAIDDSILIDTSLKWLKINVKNLLHYTDLDNTGYGTDRREGQHVAVHTHPIAITQGGIGFVRPSPDNEELWYSSFYGMFGRDSITYAIMTDSGQLSDYRCIDIRVRDPNYIPPIRICAVSAISSPLKVNGSEVDIVPDGNFQIYGESLNGAMIQLPNKRTPDELQEFHFIIQGKDEEGEWFELEEYFEPDEYTLNYPTDNEDFVVTKFGDASEFGFTNAYRLSLNVKRNGSIPFPITLFLGERELFTAQIYSTGVVKQLSYSLGEDASADINTNVDGVNPDLSVPTVSYSATAEGFETVIDWVNPTPELRNVAVSYVGTLHLDKPYYDPIVGAVQTSYDVSRNYSGVFDTNDPNQVSVVDSELQLIAAETFVWESDDKFSPMAIIGPLKYTYTNKWAIK